jgi:hypothetical protein
MEEAIDENVCNNRKSANLRDSGKPKGSHKETSEGRAEEAQGGRKVRGRSEVDA